jgi:hypothetical protein
MNDDFERRRGLTKPSKSLNFLARGVVTLCALFP